MRKDKQNRKETYLSLDMVMTGQVLNNMIRKQGYTISEIQKKLNLSCPQPIYRWIGGHTMPSIDNLYMLSTILKVHMEDLLMPRQDQAWIIHRIQNRDRNSRLKVYYGVMNAHG